MIIFLSNQLYTPNNKISGSFNQPRIDELKSLGYDVVAICPINIFPLGKYLNGNMRYKQIYENIKNDFKIPKSSKINGVLTYFPKYIALPNKVSWYSELFFLNMFAGKQIKKIILKYSPTLIISSFIHPYGTYAKYIKSYFDVKYISYFEGSDALIMPDKYGSWNKILNNINNCIDQTISVSKSMHEIVKKRGVNNNVYIPNGYREDIFLFDEDPPPIDNTVNIISIGALKVVKGHDLLIRALKILDNRFNINLTLIGIEDNNELFTNATIDMPKNIKLNRITHLPQTELPSYINSNHLLCLPSRSEGLPATALEAMACGRPVVAFDVGGLSEIIIDGFNGLLAHPEDISSLSKKIKQAIIEDWNYEEISSWTENNYGWKKSINQLNELIKNING